MKVGKSNDLKRREKQIALPIVVTIACLDEVTALRVENQMRLFVIEHGGIQHQNTIDWFKFDARIYAVLRKTESDLEKTKAEIRKLYREIAQPEARSNSSKE